METKSLQPSSDPSLTWTPRQQIEWLESDPQIPPFKSQVLKHGILELRARAIDTLQINLGYLCNQTCKHCHVDAGPHRKEIMTKNTLLRCLELLDLGNIKTVDLTGGAPEMNPDFKWFVEEVKNRGGHVMVRSNLTILTVNAKYRAYIDFFKDMQVEVVSSLPYYTSTITDRQRGDGVFDRSIVALRNLNEAGYGQEGSNLILNLVYNPNGAFLPNSQEQMEKMFKQQLSDKFGIQFNRLFSITNMPISRYLSFLVDSGNYEAYMNKLVSSFNPATVEGLMCKDLLSVSWDGYLYDCDFNQMLDLPINAKRTHIDDVDLSELVHREIVTNKHCFGCTAGSGSSCGGTTV